MGTRFVIGRWWAASWGIAACPEYFRTALAATLIGIPVYIGN
jgi:hypothetical protein